MADIGQQFDALTGGRSRLETARSYDHYELERTRLKCELADEFVIVIALNSSTGPLPEARAIAREISLLFDLRQRGHGLSNVWRVLPEQSLVELEYRIAHH